MSRSFCDKRKQQFLAEDYARNYQHTLKQWNQDLRENLYRRELGLENISLEALQLSENSYQLISLHYTAGEPIEELRSELSNVVDAYEKYQKALEAYEQIPQVSPLGLDQLGDYERAMQIIGLCILLHRPDLLARIATLIDPGYKGEDTLYEDLLSFYQPQRIELDEWYHEEPYTPLIHAMYEEDKKVAVGLLAEYCKRWYPAFKYLPWHDGHLRIDGTDGDYFGYWAFEAGAVAYLLDLDDSSIDHMVYPKDLVAWARANKHLSDTVPTDTAAGRCDAGKPCPSEGFWLSPAQQGSRRFFRVGEMMPALETSYGTTIWQWDGNQEPPKL